MNTAQYPHHFLFSVLALIAGFLLLASAASAQSDPEKSSRFSVGSNVGGLLPITELEDEINVLGSIYVRRGIVPKWQFELNGGYGRLTSSDSGTDVGMVSGRLLFIPIVRRHWNLYISGGIGILRYDWDQPNISPLRTPGLDGIGSVPMIPLGTGVRYELSDNLALEVALGYTMASSDAINAVEDGGNDAFWRGTIGLALGRFGDEPDRRTAPAVSVAQMDTDGDEVEVTQAPLTEPDTTATDDEDLSPVSDLDLLEEREDEERSVGMPTAQRTILFDLNSTELSDETEQILDGVTQDLIGAPGVAVVLRGHTDSSGPNFYNAKLGMKRALAVENYLISKGVDAGRMHLESKGESEPISPNATAAGRALNRRVEIIPIE
jgi:outer membrane protein OmpA-like peptidoglycan-associated protein/opacity protein-like surface antigen